MPNTTPIARDDGAVARHLSAFRSGDAEVAAELFRASRAPVERIIRRLLAWPGDVDDILQEIYLKAWKHRHQFRADAEFQTWITRIAINECRRWQRWQLVRWRWQKQQQMAPPAERSIPHEELDRAEEVQQAVAKLSAKLREVVVLYYLEQQTARQVATILDIPQGTVEARLSRARKKLAELMPNE